MKSIRYTRATQINHGTQEEPDIETILSDVVIECADADMESNLAVSRTQAYNGEVTVEDVGPDHKQDYLTRMAQAYMDGVAEA